MKKWIRSHKKLLSLLDYSIILSEFVIIGCVFAVPHIIQKRIEVMPKVLPINHPIYVRLNSPTPTPSPTPKPEILAQYATYRSKKKGLIFAYAAHNIANRNIVSFEVNEIGNRIYVRQTDIPIDPWLDRFVEIQNKNPDSSLFASVSDFLKDTSRYCKVTDRPNGIYTQNAVPPTRTQGYSFVTVFVSLVDDGKPVDFLIQKERQTQCYGNGYFMEELSHPDKMLFIHSSGRYYSLPFSSNTFQNGVELLWDQTIRFE